MESVYVFQPPMQLFHWDTFVLANTFLDPVQLRIPVNSSTDSGHAVQWRKGATLVREL
jgi:hypothetical protein